MSQLWKTGNTGTITATFRNRSGTLTDATAATIIIYKVSDRSEVVASTSILANKDSTGTYYYEWTPDTAGDYIAKVTATVGGKTEIGSVRFQVTDPLNLPLA